MISNGRRIPFLGRMIPLTYEEYSQSWRERRECGENGHGPMMMGRLITRSGVIRAIRFCRLCFDTDSNQVKMPYNSTRLLIIRDNRDPDDICEVCGRLGTEVHHWAPREIFGLASYRWPTSKLCTTCHRKWHRMMNAERARSNA